MVSVQIVPRAGRDAYRLLRDKVTHEAKTWLWGNKAKTRLKHKSVQKGYIEVGSADGVLVAQIRPSDSGELYMLTEKLIGRLTAWFVDDIAAINLQFLSEEPGKSKKRKRGKRH